MSSPDGTPWPFGLSRGAYQRACHRLAGLEWNRWAAEATWGLSSNAYAWATRTEAEVLADRDRALAEAAARHAEQPTWGPDDTHAERIAIAAGRDPRRTLAKRIAVNEAQAVTDARAHAKRMKSPACPACGYAAGHGHHPLCSEDA